MIKSKLAIFFDSFFSSLITNFLLFVWINRYVKNAFLSLFICNLISLCLFFALFLQQNKKYNIKKIKHNQQKFLENSYQHLIFCEEKECQKYFETLFSCTHINGCFYENYSNIFFINTKTQTTENDFFSANNLYLKSNKSKNIIFICGDISENFTKLISSSPNKFYVFNKLNLFEIMQDKQIYPIKEIPLNNQKQFNFKSLKSKLSSSLTRNRFKDFFISGVSLLTISLFIPHSLYYMFFGSLLIIFSIFCLFNKSKLKLEKQDTSLKTLIKK